ncbi:MAG: alpha/beta hydrolase [Anaerolineae bacterium]|nr:alpha/beta hydrolase [Anaerolineae bacterium]
MPIVDRPDGSLYYAESKASASSYPPLILIHGAGASRLDWPPDLRRLPGIRVITLDLPGHGKSTGPSRTDLETYAADVCALLDALQIERAIIAGHSMGGGVAQQIALTDPHRVAGLILLGTSSKLPVAPGLTQRIMADTEAAIEWLIAAAWGKNVPDAVKDLGRQRLSATPSAVMRDDYIACQSFDVREQLSQITVPTLVIAAREDQMLRLAFSATLAERIPNATLMIIENAGHMFPLEQSQAVAHIIAEWLSENL